MAIPSEHTFTCHMYVSGKQVMAFRLPAEPGPVKVASLLPLDYDQLVEPDFRKLLATFESLPKPLKVMQV